MPIYDDLNAALKTAMLAKDSARTEALRNIRAGFIEAMKKDNSATLADEECLAVIRRIAKRHAESIDSYEAAGRTELVEKERSQLAIADEFLPKMADEATVRVWVQEAIAATGATSAKEMGKVMSSVMAAHKGEADGKVIKDIAASLLK
jgi:uncharacterized protein YqeY